MKKLNVNINGNKKLINTSSVRFMIWNIPAVVTCPFATEHCKHFCYARKAERVYPQVLPAREKNMEESKSEDFVDNMVYTIESRLNSKAFANKKVYFRIHESGDFYNQKYTNAWCDIARHFENDNRITFLAYTKSVKYILNANVPKNLIVRFSIWDDTKQADIESASRLNLPIYTAGTKEEVKNAVENKGFTKCECADCANCGKCYSSEEKKIMCEIH